MSKHHILLLSRLIAICVINFNQYLVDLIFCKYWGKMKKQHKITDSSKQCLTFIINKGWQYKQIHILEFIIKNTKENNYVQSLGLNSQFLRKND
jgi:hypothetical protein